MSFGASEFGFLEWVRDHAPRSGRAAVEIPVDLHGAEGPVPGVTRNISMDGAFVVTDRPLPVGARVMLRLAFPGDASPLAVRAEVRWARTDAAAPGERRPTGMGVQFVDPPLGVSLAIGELLESERNRQL
jgi:uncharacterized protein (TIGR02266 family)